MEKKLKILNVEWKVGKDSGKKYLKAQVEHQDNGESEWMSCFEDDLIAKISKCVGQELTLTFETSGKWTNIRGVGEVSGKDSGNPDDPKSKEHSSHKVSNNKYEPNSMYVSYAKDIFVCLMSDVGSNVTQDELQGLMTTAIQLVKQAREAF